MKKLLPISLVLLLILTSVNYSCRSSQKALEHGNYYEACHLAIKKLRKSPDNEKASNTLKQAYPLLLKTSKIEIKNLQTLTTTNKNRRIYSEYVKLNTTYNNILKCPAALKIIPSPQSFINEENVSKEAAFNEVVAEADAILNEGTHASAKKAFYKYGDALKYSPNNPTVVEKQAIALDLATVKVVVEQIPVLNSNSFSAAFFYDQVFTSLNNDRKNQFLIFYQPHEAEEQQIRPDHIVTMAFDNFIIGTDKINRSSYDVSRDSVIVGSIQMDDGTEKNVYNTVKARLTVKTRSIDAQGIFTIRISDFATNKLLAHEKFEEKYVWEDSWGKYRGDSRALTEKDLKICDKEAILPPSQEDLFVEFTKPIFTKASSFLTNFYKGY